MLKSGSHQYSPIAADPQMGTTLPITKEEQYDVESACSEEQIPQKWVYNEEIAALGFLPALEGLRGLAILGPMADHALRLSPWNLTLGSLGVTMFFVLSGFLITGILIQQQKKTCATGNGPVSRVLSKYHHLPRFYTNRSVRLGPALAVVVLAGWYLVGRDRPQFGGLDNIKVAIRALFSLQNTPLFLVEGARNPFEFAWSLACEEQFYIFWSLILPVLTQLKGRTRYWILVGLIGISLSLRIYAGQSYNAHWLITWNRGIASTMWKMLLGSAIRLIPIPRHLTKRIYSHFGLLVIAIIILLSYMANDLQASHQHKVLMYDIVCTIGTVLIIIGTLQSGNPILESTFFRFLGRLSYALYLWTTLIVSANRSMFSGYRAVADESVGFIIALISTIYLEEPILRLYRGK